MTGDLNAMPYYVYKITSGPTDIIKQLEKLEERDSYRAARDSARNLRAAMNKTDTYTIKVVFADSELRAEEMLMEKREAPILREWEK